MAMDETAGPASYILSPPEGLPNPGGTGGKEIFCHEDKKHPSYSFQALNEFRESGFLCDVEIKVEEREFPCHRVVVAATIPYFRSMFSSEMRESRQKTIDIGDISADAFEGILAFCYTSRLQLAPHSVQQLLFAARILQVDSVCAACEEFLAEILTVQNCMAIRSLAQQHNCVRLRETIDTFSAENFMKLREQPEFTQMTLTHLEEIIKRSDLHVPSEKEAVRAETTGGDGKGNDSTVMSLIRRGEIDFLPPIFSLTLDRQDIPHSIVTSSSKVIYTYKKFSTLSEIGLVALLHQPRGFWFALLACQLLGSCIRWALSWSYRNLLKLISDKKNSAVLKCYHKVTINTSFWKGVLLSGIGSFVVVTFITPPQQAHPITDFVSLKREISRGNYKAVFNHEMYYQRFYGDPSSNTYLGDSASHNPPKIMMGKLFDSLELIENTTETDWPKPVLVSGDFTKNFVEKYHCRLKTTAEDSIGFPATIFFRNGFNLSLTRVHVRVIEEELQRILIKYFPRKFCGEENGGSLNEPLSLSRTTGAFLALLLALSVCLVVLFFEIFLDFFRDVFVKAFAQNENIGRSSDVNCGE